MNSHVLSDAKLRLLDFQRISAFLAILVACSFGAGDKQQFSPHEKAFYADAATVQFVRPGLNITINSAQIAQDGTITVVYTLTDPAGLPLDATGVTTPGTTSLGYVAAVLPNNSDEFTAYTTRANSGPGVALTNQPGADSGGVTTNPAPANISMYSIPRRPAASTQPPLIRLESSLRAS